MRIAIVSDIHGNLRALEAVVSDLKHVSPDLVLQGGDLAASGHRPANVIDRIRELGWAGIHGNTDEMLWAPEKMQGIAARAPKIRPLLELLFHSIAPATRELIGRDRVRWLRTLPTEWRNEHLVLVHAGPNELWQAPWPDCDESELAGTYGSCNSLIVVYGHIHRPYIRSLPNFVVANAGSVGMPYDGDPRAGYLVIDRGKVSVRRVEYDIEAESKELLASGYPTQIKLIALNGFIVACRLATRQSVERTPVQGDRKVPQELPVTLKRSSIN